MSRLPAKMRLDPRSRIYQHRILYPTILPKHPEEYAPTTKKEIVDMEYQEKAATRNTPRAAPSYYVTVIAVQEDAPKENSETIVIQKYVHNPYQEESA